MKIRDAPAAYKTPERIGSIASKNLFQRLRSRTFCVTCSCDRNRASAESSEHLVQSGLQRWGSERIPRSVTHPRFLLVSSDAEHKLFG